MKIHIGQIIHETVQRLGIKTKDLANGINVGATTVYDIYKRESLDTVQLIKISVFLKTNLLQYYFEEQPLKGLVNNDISSLKKEFEELKLTVKRKDNLIEELEKLNKVLQKRLDMN
ncbi:hypothetical protein CLV51_11064 [Chitinophaga niastensis]|uniref:HTH cro/C1-type domain-containing protein n=1 Tax=Chitinophaga niastensis TaxID=536980 RepID=A0A2P8H9F3_CHINA|nr:hypothetical protein [Chitinophaga niastensis]PSL42848.1 hypothetical protein CLV51_11064 [Chitinophaga niastensis]